MYSYKLIRWTVFSTAPLHLVAGDYGNMETTLAEREVQLLQKKLIVRDQGNIGLANLIVWIALDWILIVLDY